MITTRNPNDLVGADVFGDDDRKIGSVGQVYLDDTDKPSWVTIKTGLFGSQTFAPLSEATFDGRDVRVPFSKEFVKGAPKIADDGELTARQEQDLYAYYHGTGQDADAASDSEPSREARHEASSDANLEDRRRDLDGALPAGFGAGAAILGGPATGSAESGMNLSGERLRIGTDEVETGRASLRKHIVTERVTHTAPAHHEEVEVIREPATEENRSLATPATELSEATYDLVLTGERLHTSTETVPVERVRLGTETVIEQREITEELRREDVEVIDPDTGRVVR